MSHSISRGTQPANLAVRFVLEMSALVVLGVWGWHRGGDGFRVLVAMALPLIGAAFWGTFAVPNDPTRSGSAPVPIPGVLRLALELGFFGVAALALSDLGFSRLAAGFTLVVAIHYLLLFDHIRWLVRQ